MLPWIPVVLLQIILLGGWCGSGPTAGVHGMVLLLPQGSVPAYDSGLNASTEVFILDLEQDMYSETWAHLPHSLLEQPAKPLEWNDFTLEDDTLIAHRRRHHSHSRYIKREKEQFSDISSSSEDQKSYSEENKQTFSQRRRRRSVSHPPEEKISNLQDLPSLPLPATYKFRYSETLVNKDTVREYLTLKVASSSNADPGKETISMGMVEPYHINDQPHLSKDNQHALPSPTLDIVDSHLSESERKDESTKSTSAITTSISKSRLRPTPNSSSYLLSVSSLASQSSIALPRLPNTNLSQSSVKHSSTLYSTPLSTSSTHFLETQSSSPESKAETTAVNFDSGNSNALDNSTYQKLKLAKDGKISQSLFLENKVAFDKEIQNEANTTETSNYLDVNDTVKPSVTLSRSRRWASDSVSQDNLSSRSRDSKSSISDDSAASRSQDSLNRRSQDSSNRRSLDTSSRRSQDRLSSRSRDSQTYRLRRLERLRRLRASLRRRRTRPKGVPMAQAIVRRRRPARVDAKIGVLVVVDNSIYRQYLKDNQYSRQAALAKIKRYYGTVFAMMDQRFGTINDPSLSISVRISGILVAESREEASWLEQIVDWSTVSTHGRASFHTDKALRRFSTWIIKHKDLPKYDHAMVFTGYRLSSRSGVGLGGMAYMKAVCDTDSGNAVSIVGDRGDFQNVKVATHELAHSLGAYHDGYPTATACPAENNYIMTPVGSHQKEVLKNAFYFSRCSIRDMYNHLRKARSACIRDEPVVYHRYDVSSYPPGHLYTADQQCKLIFGKNSQFCNVHQGPDGLEGIMCGLLWCKDPEKDNSCRTNSYLAALPGTTCGPSKVCHLGQCVPDPRRRVELSGRASPRYHKSRPEVRTVPSGNAIRPTRLPTLRGRSNSLPGMTQRPPRPSFRMRGQSGSHDRDRGISRDRDRDSLSERRRLRIRRRNGRRRRIRRRRRHRTRPERQRPKPDDQRSSRTKSRLNEINPVRPRLRTDQRRPGNRRSRLDRFLPNSTTPRSRPDITTPKPSPDPYRPERPRPRSRFDQNRPKIPRSRSDPYRPDRPTKRPDPYRPEQPGSRSNPYRPDHPRLRSDLVESQRTTPRPDPYRPQQPRSRSDPYKPQRPRSMSDPYRPQQPRSIYNSQRPQRPRSMSDPYRPQQPRSRYDPYRPQQPRSRTNVHSSNTESHRSQRPGSRLDPYRRDRPQSNSHRYRPERPRCTADKNPRYCQGLVRLNPGGCRRQAIREYCCVTCHYQRRRRRRRRR